MPLTPEQLEGAFSDLTPKKQSRLSDDALAAAFADLKPVSAGPRDTTLGEKAAGVGLSLAANTQRAVKGVVDLVDFILPKPLEPYITDPAIDQFQRGIDAAEALSPEAFKQKRSQGFLKRAEDGSIEGLQLPSIEHVSDLVAGTLPQIPFFIAGGQAGSKAVQSAAPGVSKLIADALGFGTTNAALIAPGQYEDTKAEVLAAGGTEQEAHEAGQLAANLTALLTFTTGSGGGALSSKVGGSAQSLPGAIAKGFVAEGPFEGAEEGGQSLISDLAANRDLDFNQAIDVMVSAGMLGGAPGAAIAGTEFASNRGRNDTPAPRETEELDLREELNDRIDQAREQASRTIAGQSPVIREFDNRPSDRTRDVPVQDTTRVEQPPEPEPELPLPGNVVERVPLDAYPEVAPPDPAPAFDARTATEEERTARQQQIRDGEIQPDPNDRLRAYKKGNMFQAVELPDGSWMTRSKPHYLAKFSEWEKAESVDTAGLQTLSTNSGKVKIPGVGMFKIGERYETDSDMRGPPDLLQELAGGPKLNRAAFMSEFGIDVADTKEVRPLPGRFDGVFVDEGGLTPDGLVEWMQEIGYLPEPSPDAPNENTMSDAYELLDQALSGDRVVSLIHADDEAAFQQAVYYAEEHAKAEAEAGDADGVEAAFLAGYESEPGMSDAEIEFLANQVYEREVANVIEGETPGVVPQRRPTQAAAARPEAGRESAPEPATREPQAAEGGELDLQGGEQPVDDDGGVVTSTKNEVVEQEREARGVDQILSEARVSNPETVDEALQTLDQNPLAADEITSRLNENLSDEISVQDEAVLLVKKVQLMKAREKAAERASDETLTDDQRNVAQQEWAETEAQITEIDQATRRSGTIWGRFGQFRARLLREDYSFVAMERKARAVRGRALTLEESNDIQAQAKKIEQLERRNEEMQQRIQDLEDRAASKVVVDELSSHFSDTVKPVNTREWLENLNRKADESREWLRSNLGNANAGVDPTAFFHLARIGAAHFANGAVRLVDWIAAMRADLGPKVYSEVEDQLETIYYQAKEQAEADAVDSGQAIPTQGELVAKPTATQSIALDAAADAAAGLQLSHRSVYQLAKAHIRQGMRGEDLVMKAVHADLEPFFLGLTERDVRRLFSEYGKAKYPSKAEDKVLLRELRELVRLQESIDRLLEGKAPLRTGLQRDKPTKKVRDKMRDLNARMAEFEARLPDHSPDRLASVNDARVTRLRNQIADLEDQIRTGREPVAGKPVDPTAEVVQLTQMRDALKEKIRQIEEAKNPPPTEEEKYQITRGKQLRRQLKEVQARLKTNDYAPRKRPAPKELNEENKQVAYDLAQAKAKFVAEQYKWELDQATKTRKAFRFVGRMLNFSRSIKTSFDLSGFGRQGGIAVLAHPGKVGSKTFGKQFKALRSEKEAHALQEEIFNHPRTDFALKAGLFLNQQDGAKPNQREEVYMDEWVKRTPGVAASARAYTVGLNAIRITYFNHLVDTLGRGGKVTPEEAKHIAYWVNRATGRGSLAQFGDTGGTTVFFAPRWVQSRFSVLSGWPILSAPTNRLKRQIAGEYVRFAAGYAAWITLVSSALALMGDEEEMSISTDPKSTDFLKLKIGDTRIDMTAALSSPVVFLTRVLGGKKTTQSGREVSLVDDVPYGGDTTWDIISRFIRSKLAPPIAAAINIRAGTNVVGEETSIPGELVGLVTPLSLSDALQAIESQGVPRGTAITLLSIIGAASNTYAVEEADGAPPRRPKTRTPTERAPASRD